MEGHFTYLSPIIPSPEGQKIVAAILLGLSLLFLGKKLAAKIATRADLEANVVPAEKINSFGIFDYVVEAFINYQDTILGKERRHFLPFTLSIFLFVLLSNLLGLIPGMPAITTTVWVTVAVACLVFVYFNYHGIKAQGFWGYLKHFGGPIWWLAWFMFPLEIFSTFLRILTLNLRLYWNISADHIVLGIGTDMVGFLSFPLYVLGTFVSFMQAFVLTTLTMVYLLLATQHGEDHHDTEASREDGHKAHH